jgi:hypothetical protein
MFRKARLPVSADVFGEPNKLSANGVLQHPDTEAAAVRKTILGHDAMMLIRVTRCPNRLT